MAYVSPKSRKARALLDTIAGPESAGSYNVSYGGQKFNSFDAHPGTGKVIGVGPNAGKISTAAGRYQFTKGTWNEQAKKYGLEDFSPEAQDIAGFGYAQSTAPNQMDAAFGSMAPGDVAKLGQALSGKWTSLPGGIEQQIGPQSFTNAFNRNFGELGPGYPSTPAESLMSPTPMADQYVGPEAGMWGFNPVSFGAPPPDPIKSTIAPSNVAAFDVAARNFTQDTIPGALSPMSAAMQPGPAPMNAMVAAAPSEAPAAPDMASIPSSAFSPQSFAVNPMTDTVGGLPSAMTAFGAPTAPGPNLDPYGAPAPGSFSPGQFGAFSPVSAVSAPQQSVTAGPTQAEMEAAKAKLTAGLAPQVSTVNTMSMPGLTDAQIGMGAPAAPSPDMRVDTAFGQMPGPSVAPNGVVHYGQLSGITTPQTQTVAAPQAAPSVAGLGLSPATMAGPAPMSNMATMPGALSPMSAALQGPAPTVSAPQASVQAPSTPEAQTFGAPPAAISAPAPAMPMARPPGLMAAPAPAVTVAAPAALANKPQTTPEAGQTDTTNQSAPALSMTANTHSAGQFARANAAQMSALGKGPGAAISGIKGALGGLGKSLGGAFGGGSKGGMGGSSGGGGGGSSGGSSGGGSKSGGSKGHSSKGGRSSAGARSTGSRGKAR